MTYANAAERQALIYGLRELASFLQENADVPAPQYTDVLVFPQHADSDAEQRREIDVIAAQVNARPREAVSGHYTVSRFFGPVEYRAVAIDHTADNSDGD